MHVGRAARTPIGSLPEQEANGSPLAESTVRGQTQADTFHRAQVTLRDVAGVFVSRSRLRDPIALESRGPEGSPIRQTMDRMLDRAGTSTTRIEGRSAQDFLRDYIFRNPDVTNQQIMAMERVPLSAMAASPGVQAASRAIAPNYASLPSHRMGVDLLHAVTGIDRDALSRSMPDVGLSGSVRGMRYAWVPQSAQEQQTTALHDFTSVMSSLGRVQLNLPVWGYSDIPRSGAASYLGMPIIGGRRR